MVRCHVSVLGTIGLAQLHLCLVVGKEGAMKTARSSPGRAGLTSFAESGGCKPVDELEIAGRNLVKGEHASAGSG
jgi:hypothetical protein